MTNERPTAELIQSLIDARNQLDEYAQRAFQNREPAFVGEVAGKLRVLVCSGGRSHEPLLLKMMERFAFPGEIRIEEIRINNRTVRPEKRMSLRDFMKEVAFSRPQGDKWFELTNEEVIRTLAEKDGAAHVEWRSSTELSTVQGDGLSVVGMMPGAYLLIGVTRTVLRVADEFLTHLERIGVIQRVP